MIFVEYLPDQFSHHLSLSMADNQGIIFINQNKSFNMIISAFVSLPAGTLILENVGANKLKSFQIQSLYSLENLRYFHFAYFQPFSLSKKLKCKVLKTQTLWEEKIWVIFKKIWIPGLIMIIKPGISRARLHQGKKL